MFAGQENKEPRQPRESSMYVQLFGHTADEIHRNPAKVGKWDYGEMRVRNVV